MTQARTQSELEVGPLLLLVSQQPPMALLAIDPLPPWEPP